MKTVITPKAGASLVSALCAGLLAFSLAAFDAAAQDRANKGGEVRGKDRGTAVQEMNTERKAEDGDTKEKKAKTEKTEKKTKKSK